jgi:hypothetical protein
LYQYSDLSIKNIAQELRMPLNDVQRIADKLSKLHAVKLFEQESTTKIEKIMSTNIVSLDISKTAADAAALMTEKKVGSEPSFSLCFYCFDFRLSFIYDIYLFFHPLSFFQIFN